MMAIGRDSLGGRRKIRAGRTVQGALALILLACALALPALPVRADDRMDQETHALFEAVRGGTASEVKAALAAGGNPGGRSASLRSTPLHRAAADNANPSVITALIEGGADPGARDVDGKTPLHWAVADNANPSVIAALLKAGADPDARMNEKAGRFAGGTPLHWAAFENANPSVVAALLEGGADPGARTEHGVTPLHWAVQSGKPSVILALIKGGADPGARAAFGFTPLHLAAGWNSNPSVILALIEAGADPGARMERDETPLPPRLAAAANLAAGITPLHWAAGWNSNPSVILALVEGGADPGARDDAGRTPFDYAKDNKALKGTEAYWLLNEARFE